MALDYKSSLARYRKYLQVAQEKPVVRASIFLMLSLTLVIGMLVFALRPTLTTVAGLLGQIKQQRQVAEALNRKIVAINEARANFDRIQSRIYLLDSALPTNSQWSEWVVDLQRMASESGVLLTRASIDGVQIVGNSVPGIKKVEVKPSLPTGVTAVGFSVDVVGNYLQLKQYLQDIENSRRIAIVNEIRLNKDTSGELTLTVVGNVGYFNLPIAQ
jgi:Tfp pilus assembly protein PilO